MKHFTLVALSADRRIAAVAIFRDVRLEDTKLRHLPVDAAKASGSLRQLVLRALEWYRPDVLAIRRPARENSERIRLLCQDAKQLASELGIPTVEVDDVTLSYAYGHPPLVRKEDLRRVGHAIWPGLADAVTQTAAVDAALTGLYVQTERLFSLYEEGA